MDRSGSSSLDASEAGGQAMSATCLHMGDCQNYAPFLGPNYNTGPNTGLNLGDPKRDHNFDNLPYVGST